MQRRHALIVAVLTASLIGCEQQPKQKQFPAAAPPGLQAAGSGYIFQRGFPIGNTAQKAYDDADLNRAVEAYRFF